MTTKFVQKPERNGVSKSNNVIESVWSRAFKANSDWPDKVTMFST